jgi:cation transport regulator ChaC
MGQANLTGHQLRFHKKSKDGSAKCDAFRTGDEGDIVCGVLFEIAQNEKTQLDRAEGLGKGYDYQVIEVQRADGSVCEAHAYVASPAYVDTSLNPTAAYMQFVLDGAREHRLPSGYVEKFISTVPTTGGHEL